MQKQTIAFIKISGLLLVVIACLTACQKNYITGGKTEDVNKYKNVSTFDYLKSVPQFDTLTQLIEAGNLQDAINGQGTYFAVPNNVIYRYLNARTLYLQNTVNQDAKFTLDSLKYYIQNNIDGTKDSLLMYFIPGQVLTPDKLTNNGALYPSGLQGDTVAVSYEYTKDGTLGYTGLVSSIPQIVYFTQLWGSYAIDQNNPIADVPTDVGVHTTIATSFIYTQSGVVNVLRPEQPLFFYGSN